LTSSRKQHNTSSRPPPFHNLESPPEPALPHTWNAYLLSLPQWEQELLADSSIVERRQLFQALRTSELVYLASDGGATDRRGSFGALLASCNTILAECGGRAHGADPRSFRAEGYGLLAILRLAFHLRTFYHTYNSNLKFRLYCDSESLLLQLEASRKLNRSLPRRFLYLEVDIEMQILMAIQALGGPVYMEHVEGHQDTKYPDKPLPWAATLNMRCDEIATLHLEAAVALIPSVAFLPASKVSLSIGGQTITHHIPTQLRTFAGLHGIKDHYRRHHGWDSPAVFDLIAWPLFHQATLTTTFLRRLFVIKWIHSLLPFQRKQFKFNQSPSASCPSVCRCIDEDWRHFPRCPHEQGRQSWAAFMPLIAALMERWSLDPSLRRVMLSLLSPLTDAPTIPLTNLPAEYSMLLTTQQSIGADSLLFGLFSTEWVRLQSRYLRAVGLPSAHNEPSCAIGALLVAFHDQCHAVWLLRNQHLHGTDPRNISSFKHLHLLAQIQELYDAAPHMMLHDRNVFAYPFEVRHLQSTSALNAFYQHAKPIVETSLKDALRLGPRFLPLDHYFPPVQNTIPQNIFDIIL
jgi:hypothetical protein